MSDGITLRKVEHASWVAADCRRYEVLLDGVVIGQVDSHRTETWRETHTGVRSSLVGRPKHWQAEAIGWLPDADEKWKRYLGGGTRPSRWYKRQAAVDELVARYREVHSTDVMPADVTPLAAPKNALGGASNTTTEGACQ